MRTLGVFAAVATMALLGACGSSTSTQTDSPSQGAEAISAPSGVYVNGPLLIAPEPEPGSASPTAAIGGTVTYDGTCVLLAGIPVVWPYGTTWDEQAQQVSTPHGVQVGLGELAEGGGAILTWASADRQMFTGQAADLIDACIGESGEVAFFNPGSPSTSAPV